MNSLDVMCLPILKIIFMNYNLKNMMFGFKQLLTSTDNHSNLITLMTPSPKMRLFINIFVIATY